MAVITYGNRNQIVAIQRPGWSRILQNGNCKRAGGCVATCIRTAEHVGGCTYRINLTGRQTAELYGSLRQIGSVAYKAVVCTGGRSSSERICHAGTGCRSDSENGVIVRTRTCCIVDRSPCRTCDVDTSGLSCRNRDTKAGNRRT